MKKRLGSISLVLVLMLSLILSGCANSGENESAGSASASSESKEKDSNGDATEIDEANFNTTGLPVVNETVTLKVAGYKRDTIKKPFEELQVMKDIEVATNINVEWDVTPKASWKERKNLIIASGDLPDVFYGAYIIEDNEIMSLASDGVLLPIEDLIEEYAPNIQAVFDEYPEVKAYMTAPDGHIYSLPTINAYQSIAPSAQFINQTWLDEVGMDIPTTTDEFYEVLKAFKANGEDGEIPMSFRFENGAMGINGMFGSFGVADNTKKLTIVDDKVVYTPMTEAYKDAVIYFHKLIDEGLVDLESFSQDVPVYKSKIKNGTVGVVNMWSRTWIFGGAYEDSDYVFMPPLAGPNGDNGYFTKVAPYISGKGSFLITTACENPEVAIRWADYMVDPDVSFQLSQGPIGETYDYNSDGMLEAIVAPEGMSQDEFRHNNTPGAHSFHMITASYLENVVASSGIAEKQSYDKVYEETKTNSMLPPFFVSPDDASEAAMIAADIGPYIKEMTSKWLMTGGIEEEWDEFIEQLNKMRVQDYIAIYQTRYDEIK